MKNFKVWAGAMFLAALVAGTTSCSKDQTTVATSGSASLKSITLNEVDSIMITRDPSGSGIGAYRMYGIKLTDDTYPGLTSSVSTDDATLDYQLYFYNEKAFAYDTTTTGTGCPALFLGAGVTGYNTGSAGYAAFDNMDTSSIVVTSFNSDAAATLPISSTSAYRFSNGKLMSTIKTGYYNTSSFLIGNRFQTISTKYIYIIKVPSYNDLGDIIATYYYALMVSRFQNGTSQTNVAGTDKRYMTIRYKLLK
jgi:hypothetical protein